MGPALGELVSRPSSWLTGMACDTVGALVADEMVQLFDAADQSDQHSSLRTTNALLYVHLDSITIATHRFLPDPMCPACGVLPDDTAERAPDHPPPQTQAGSRCLPGARAHPGAPTSRSRPMWIPKSVSFVACIQVSTPASRFWGTDGPAWHHCGGVGLGTQRDLPDQCADRAARGARAVGRDAAGGKRTVVRAASPRSTTPPWIHGCLGSTRPSATHCRTSPSSPMTTSWN